MDQALMDTRNAVLLLDPKRRLFLASLRDARLKNSYARLYRRYGLMLHLLEKQRDLALESEDWDQSALWQQLVDRYTGFVQWLDDNLIMTGSLSGKRVKDLVQVLSTEKGSVAPESAYLTPYTGQGAPGDRQPSVNGTGRQEARRGILLRAFKGARLR